MNAQNGKAGPTAPGFSFLAGLSILLISAALIAYQIVLMRCLSITRYHHFAYFVIGTALLGFGVSGTFLSFTLARLRRRFHLWSTVLIFLFCIFIPLSYLLAETIPVDIQYVLFSAGQFSLLFLYALIISIPFFFGGTLIGLSLTAFERDRAVVYGVNLFGSGAGGASAIALLFIFPPFDLPAVLSAVVFCALLSWGFSFRTYFSRGERQFVLLLLAAGLAASVAFLFFRPEIAVDDYKMLSHLERLRNQGGAERVLTSNGPRGRIDVYKSGSFHQSLFAALNADVLPPPQLPLLIDGNLSGSVLQITSAGEASILQTTPQSLAYRLSQRPRVLLLGETGGANVWLAKQYDPASITVVQGNPQVARILRQDLAGLSGNVMNSPGVKVVTEEPHLFIRRTGELYDLIHIVTAEGFSAGVSGLQSLHEDYLLTVESFAYCVQRLSGNGLITITRGIQSPPRDNLKLFGLFISALERLGVSDPGRHLLQARNYLAANTILTKQPIDETTIEQYREQAGNLLMDIEYYPGIRSGDISQTNVIEGPAGTGYSFLHYGLMQIISRDREGFYNAWPYHIRPPSDDKPYFYDFFKWKSLRRFIEVYGGQWFQRLELGYIVLAVTFLVTTAVAFVLILLPLFRLRAALRAGGKGLFTAVYFPCLGFGYMFIEMVFIQKFIRFMGDPVYSVAVAITAILAFSGMGSIYQSRASRPVVRIRYAALAVSSIALLAIFLIDPLLDRFVGLGVQYRAMIAILSLAPLSFFMGWMFPNGLAVLEKSAKDLIPWAWGLNGFASVAAAPLSVLLTMSYGFSGVLLLAVLFYLAAGYVAGRMETIAFSLH